MCVDCGSNCAANSGDNFWFEEKTYCWDFRHQSDAPHVSLTKTRGHPPTGRDEENECSLTERQFGSSPEQREIGSTWRSGKLQDKRRRRTVSANLFYSLNGEICVFSTVRFWTAVYFAAHEAGFFLEACRMMVSISAFRLAVLSLNGSFPRRHRRAYRWSIGKAKLFKCWLAASRYAACQPSNNWLSLRQLPPPCWKSPAKSAVYSYCERSSGFDLQYAGLVTADGWRQERIARISAMDGSQLCSPNRDWREVPFRKGRWFSRRTSNGFLVSDW